MADTVFYDKDGQGYTPSDILAQAGGALDGADLLVTAPDDTVFRIIVGNDGVLDTEAVV